MRAKRKGIKTRGSAKESATQRHTQPMSWEASRLSREHCYTEEVEQRLALLFANLRAVVPDVDEVTEFLDREKANFLNDLFTSRSMASRD